VGETGFACLATSTGMMHQKWESWEYLDLLLTFNRQAVVSKGFIDD